MILDDFYKKCKEISKPRAYHLEAIYKPNPNEEDEELEEYCDDEDEDWCYECNNPIDECICDELENEINNNLKTEKEMTKLEQLKIRKEDAVKEFTFITPVMDYIDKHYSEYKDELNASTIEEILEEIKEKEGMLVFIGTNNKLYTPYYEVRNIDTRSSNKINTYENSIRINIISSNKETAFIDKFHTYFNAWGEHMYSHSNTLADVYYVKDIKDIIEFINKEKEEISKENHKKELELIAESNLYLAKAKEYGLDTVNRSKIDRLDKVKEAQTKGLNKLTVVELYELLNV